MSTTSRHGLELLSCARAGLTLTECMKDDRERPISRSLSTLTDYRQVTSRHLARQRTINRLVWDYPPAWKMARLMMSVGATYGLTGPAWMRKNLTDSARLNCLNNPVCRSCLLDMGK